MKIREDEHLFNAYTASYLYSAFTSKGKGTELYEKRQNIHAIVYDK